MVFPVSSETNLEPGFMHQAMVAFVQRLLRTHMSDVSAVFFFLMWLLET